VLGTLTMLVIVGAFVLAYFAVAAVVSLWEERRPELTAARYAPTLIPIAVVYFIAHYLIYWLYVGQLTPGTVADPFEKEWVPDYKPWTPLGGRSVWWIEAALIVWGHIVAVLEAHRVSLARQGSPRRALVAQIPLVLLMVAYTFSGLWVLGQALRP
jgi:amino acid transporter